MDTNSKLGILCPISALPNRFGIGDFGDETKQFIHILKEQHIDTWQILPWHPSLQANSPYRSISCYAGDEIYISLDRLIEMGLLEGGIRDLNKQATRVDYDMIRIFKRAYLKKAYTNFVPDSQYETFINQYSWVRWYAIYRVFSEVFRTPSWALWPRAYKEYPIHQTIDLSKYQERIEYHMFLQYIFFTQWWEIKKLANDNGITIFGDIPFYVDVDSVEVWREPGAFLLDGDAKPIMVAGVPPDYFSATGQKWGNPVYNWHYLKEHKFSFWISRLDFANQLFDEIRIDHFRAFDTYWMIPFAEETAIHGSWQEAPGYALLDTIYQEIDNLYLIAEDLGDIRWEVTKLKDTYHIPGMRVFQFQWHEGFAYLENTLLYTGTHDNETLMGWYSHLDVGTKERILSIIQDTEENIHLKIINFCLKNSKYVIVPVWDVLGLDNHARFNVPGTNGKNNWTFRLQDVSKIENSLKRMQDFIN